MGLPSWLSIKNLPVIAGDKGDVGSVSGFGRSFGRRNGTPLQYSCLENSMGRGDWWAIVHGVTKSWTCLSIHCKEFLNTTHKTLPSNDGNSYYLSDAVVRNSSAHSDFARSDRGCLLPAIKEQKCSAYFFSFAVGTVNYKFLSFWRVTLSVRKKFSCGRGSSGRSKK